MPVQYFCYHFTLIIQPPRTLHAPRSISIHGNHLVHLRLLAIPFYSASPLSIYPLPNSGNDGDINAAVHTGAYRKIVVVKMTTTLIPTCISLSQGI